MSSIRENNTEIKTDRASGRSVGKGPRRKKSGTPTDTKTTPLQRHLLRHLLQQA